MDKDPGPMRIGRRLCAIDWGGWQNNQSGAFVSFSSYLHNTFPNPQYANNNSPVLFLENLYYSWILWTKHPSLRNSLWNWP